MLVAHSTVSPASPIELDMFAAWTIQGYIDSAGIHVFYASQEGATKKNE